MPKRDPFVDKRRRAKGNVPKQAALQRKRRRERSYYKKTKTEKLIKENEKILTKQEKSIEFRKELIQAMEKAPSAAEQKKLTYVLFQKLDFNPLEEMINLIQEDSEDLSMMNKINALKFLTEYYQAKPKSIDIHQSGEVGLNVSVADYSKVTQKQLKENVVDPVAGAQPIIEVTDNTSMPTAAQDSEYNEFLSPEELAQKPSND